jgi:XapX domain-containing protein
LNLKLFIGLLLGLGIGFGCRWLGIPSPAPPLLAGALLVVAMTSGYVVTDAWLAKHPAHSKANCGGPTGETRGMRT